MRCSVTRSRRSSSRRPASRRVPSRPGRERALAAQVIVRTRFYDACLSASTSRQVVLLAAGLDARAYRLDWPPGTRVFEADLEPVLEFKQRVLDASGAQPRCERVPVPVDLRRDDWPEVLRAAGFDPGQPTAWLVEGLLVYLSREEAAGVLSRLTGASAPGSTLALERSAHGRIPPVEGVTTLWQGGLGAGTADRLREHGWDVTLTNLGEAAQRYGRPFAKPTESAFVTAVRTG
ncbi:SAM-dependent methyltransferase [Streptacidiphilus monticola]